MDVLFEGNIKEETDMSRVMQSIMQQTADKPSILRITSSPLAVNGKIAVMKGGYIIGARESNGDTRYNALRKLLAVKNGSYAVLNADPDEFTKMDQQVLVKVERLLPHLPSITTLTDGIFDSWAQSDRPLIPELQPPPVVLKEHVTKQMSKPARFDRFLYWERMSEKFLGVFLWLIFILIGCGSAYWIMAVKH